ncbi:zinc finger protein [Macleaya cordata]|uniref:Zinc finger protein n=1 Tax=Macleaya cordata TaxID=56857 RepID=A0A200PP86_MACCD|nr:zinc finger protein [Macleaya cordata]
MVTPYSYPFRRPFDKAPLSSPPHHGNKPQTNFDTNMVIILAALLCALICTLGLNSIIRCALRCGRRFRIGSQDDEAVTRFPDTGLKKRALRQIPVTVYGGSGANIPVATDCPICLGEFIEGEKLRVLPKCNHEFHVRCIDTWLLSHSSCPTCRHSLLEQPAPETDVDAGIQSTGNGSAGGMIVIVDDV